MERVQKAVTSESQPNSLHSEHLAEGVKPIIACFTESVEEVRDRYLHSKDTTTYVDYEVARDTRVVEGVTRLKDFSAIGCISDVSDTNKYSDRFSNCVGLVVVGRLKESQQNESFMLHVQPDYFSRTTDMLEAEMAARLKQIKADCEEGTFDAALFAGTIVEVAGDGSAHASLEYYISAIQQLGEEVQESLAFEPVVINAKDFHIGTTAAYFDTTERRLYIGQPSIRPEQNQRQFLPSQARDFTPKYERHPFLDIKLPNMGPWED